MPRNANERRSHGRRRDAAIALVEAFHPHVGPRATSSRRRTLQLLRTASAPFDRHSYDPGHVTASGLVFSADGNRVLLVFHRRLERWLQPGGHVEAADPHVLSTAVREVREETGITVRADAGGPELVSVDVHEIPPGRGEPAHLHHDLMFRFSAADDELEVPHEARRAVWCPVKELEAYQVDTALLNGITRAT
jgi:8-oxo-dGTP pyrophosphatase MutT (NUDIX family)